jgi:hypothetical protein
MMSAKNVFIRYECFVALKFRNFKTPKSLILIALFTAVFSVKKQIMFLTMHKFLALPRDKITFFGIN